MNSDKDNHGFAAECVLALAAARAKGLNLSVYCEAVKKFGGPAGLFAAKQFERELAPWYQLTGSRQALSECRDALSKWRDLGLSFIFLGGPQYPEKLSAIFEPPPILFYRGTLTADHWKRGMLSIVGSRNADSKGCEFAAALAEKVARGGNCVVSGLAYGIDAAAHRGALASKREFSTVAVLGSGLLELYPAKHTTLAKEIVADGGIILSQFEPPEKPYPVNFLSRNRVIAGLSEGVVVVQAQRKSGALVTARYALEEGREVFAVPGAPSDPRSEGTNHLLKQGAYVTTCAEDIFAVLGGLTPAPTASEQDALSAVSAGQKEILDLIKEQGTVHADTLRRSLSCQALDKDLLELELSGLVSRHPGNFYALGAALVIS